MSVIRRLGASVLLVGLVACASGCTDSESPATVSLASPVKDRSVTVTRGDVTPVVTFDAEVASSVEYDITAPVDGVVSHNPIGLTITDGTGKKHEVSKRSLDSQVQYLVPDGSSVTRGLPIAKSVYSGFVVASSIAGVDLLRMQVSPESAKAQIAGGAEPFSCDLLDRVPSSSGDQSPRRLYCIIPESQPAMGGLTGVLALRFPSVRDAMVLPLEAVGGSLSSGSVRLEKNGVSSLRSVKLGPSDGTQIVITEGLDEGDTVLLPSPSLIHD